MKVLIDSETYRIDFRYIPVCSIPGGRGVECALTLIPPDDTQLPMTTVATAWCHPNDNFRKETGRKMALARVLGRLGFDKPRRTLVWQAYLGRKRGRAETSGKV